MSCLIASTTPPLAVPSSLVSTMPSMSIASLKISTWLSAFCPVVASSTIRLWRSASGNSRSITRSIFFNSSIRFFLLCSRPAVSTSTTSVPRLFAELMASNTTAAGSLPSSCLIIRTLARLAHTSSCSLAAARKVSAAAITTDLPCFTKMFASLPIVVVFPTPFTPLTIITVG